MTLGLPDNTLVIVTYYRAYDIVTYYRTQVIVTYYHAQVIVTYCLQFLVT